ncbi:hypothetical protein ACVME8_009714 [Bradyrhizobium diazoefficiens]
MRNFHEADYPPLLDLLYDAALMPERWQAFLDALPGPFGGACAVLRSYDVATAATPSFRHFGDPSFSSSRQIISTPLILIPARLETVPIRKMVYASDILAPEIAKRTGFYNDFGKPKLVTAIVDTLGVFRYR